MQGKIPSNPKYNYQSDWLEEQDALARNLWFVCLLFCFLKSWEEHQYTPVNP